MIRTQGLSYSYPQGPALVFPDVDVPQGAVLLLSGPSGCGKSTWLALAAALVTPTAGSITVAGQPLTTLTKIAADAWRAGAIGFLPQKLHLSAALNVQQNLALAQWASGAVEDQAAITQALTTLGVASLARRKPAQLSGGQAQRVALARAVLLKPKVILADEPTASLDDEAATGALRLLLTTAHAQGATLVIATHDARVAAMMPTEGVGQNRLQWLKLARQPSSLE